MKWKLTIEQKVPYEYEGKTHYSTKEVTFVSGDLSELTIMIERFSHCEIDCETSYKIEKVGDKQ